MMAPEDIKFCFRALTVSAILVWSFAIWQAVKLYRVRQKLMFARAKLTLLAKRMDEIEKEDPS